ncbi:uncharacterized protein [Bos taurus]|uniref:uncharacterized protein isoform X4 n=1 Tax=Bos taurus TaxID=9913 RepID=UPI000572C683|nr:uncharacterized protein LOC101904339 isoform X4 [Bos taurus]
MVIGEASRKRWAGRRYATASGGLPEEGSERRRPRGRSGRGSKHGNGPQLRVPTSISGLESGRLQPLPPIARPTVFHSPCGPLGGNLAQALLFSRTAYGCSPQCLLPASSLEVQVWSAFSRWWEATAFPATRSSPRGSPSSWVMLPRPPQHPAPSPTSLASRCRGLSVFGSRMARHPVGATDEKQCQCPAAPCAQNQQLWNPSPRVHSWSHFRAVGWRFGWHFPRPSPAPFSFGSLVFSY